MPWISNRIFELFSINKDAFSDLREEVASLKVERDSIQRELLTSKANFDWLRIRMNGLEAERAQLLEKAYGIRVPVPEIVRSQTLTPSLPFNADIFNDVGDDMAKNLGYPIISASNN